MNTTLVVMAAGIGSRYGGGIKQLEKMGPNGEIIMDYAIFDAKRAGFNKVVFIIRKDLEKDFREIIGNRIEQVTDVDYAFQELSDLPAGFTVPADRKKPWGTGQAVLSVKGLVNEPFAVINADDYYGPGAYALMLSELERLPESGRACMVACKQWHDLPADMSTPFAGQYQSHKDLNSHTWNLIQMQERIDSEGKFHWDFFKKQCMHCGEPACASGCPEEAIEKKPSGAVVIDEDKCVGCGYCTANCPFGIPKVDAERKKSTKCDLCFDRIEQGMQPSCAKTCTADAILFGTREEMLKKAEERLAMIKDTHPDANIYNPQGVGGVHMLYVLPEKPAGPFFD